MSNYYTKKERIFRAQQELLFDRGIRPYCFEEHCRAVACFGAALQFFVGESCGSVAQANLTDTTGIIVPVPYIKAP